MMRLAVLGNLDRLRLSLNLLRFSFVFFWASVSFAGNEWHGSTTTNHFETQCKIRRASFAPDGDLVGMVRFLPELNAATADTLATAYDAIETIVDPKADGQVYTGTWIHVNTFLEYQPDQSRIVGQEIVKEGSTNIADAQLFSYKAAARDNTANQGDGGDVDVLVRYWPRLDITTAKTHADALEGPNIDSYTNPTVQGETFSGIFMNSFVTIERESKDAPTYRVEQFLTNPNEPDTDGTPDDDETDYSIVLKEYEQGQLISATKEWPRISDATARSIMSDPGAAGVDDLVGTGGWALDIHRAVRVDNEDGTARVRTRWSDLDGGSGAVYTRDIIRKKVEKQPNREAVDGFRWRVVQHDIDCQWTTSASTAYSHAQGGMSSSFSKQISRNQWYAEEVEGITDLGDGGGTPGWQYTAWPSGEDSTP